MNLIKKRGVNDNDNPYFSNLILNLFHIYLMNPNSFQTIYLFILFFLKRDNINNTYC